MCGQLQQQENNWNKYNQRQD